MVLGIFIGFAIAVALACVVSFIVEWFYGDDTPYSKDKFYTHKDKEGNKL